MSRLIASIDDLSDTEIDHILARATDFERGEKPPRDQSRIVGLLFEQTSLRTRVGFAAATARLGWQSIDASERRHDSTSMIESWEDTLRTLSGYLDILVARPGVHLTREVLEASLSIPYVNGGSVPPDAEHPSQALIDLYAIEAELGPIAGLHIGMCGDLRMRAVRSLLRLLSRRMPRRLALITVPDLLDRDDLPPAVKSLAEFRDPWEVSDLDVLYVAGIPHQVIPDSQRGRLRVTTDTLHRLPDTAVILSPLPLIDEITRAAKTDRRVKIFAQSRRGLYVRMALLHSVVS